MFSNEVFSSYIFQSILKNYQVWWATDCKNLPSFRLLRNNEQKFVCETVVHNESLDVP